MSKLRATSLKTSYFTPLGLEKIRIELEFLKKTKRIEIAERIQQARDDSNFEESAEYEAALDEQALIESRILDLEDAVKRAAIISDQVPHDIITLGSTVQVEIEGEINEFTIVGKMEANPLEKKISNESPVGSVLLGSRIGDNLEVKTPISSFRCKVLDIK